MDVDTLWNSVLLLLHVFQFTSGNKCSFPEEWRGTWYENGLGELTITAHAISHKGHCVSSLAKKYLLLDGNKGCYKCMVFTPQHDNLLQYKESYCVNDDKIESVCGEITGNFMLHTIVKVSGQPIACPFQGPYTFSYTNESVDCKEPLSEIQACADKSRFIFDYQRCKRLPHTQAVRLSFQCLATWFSGDYYLYGKFSSPDRPGSKRMYRCFMYSLYGTRGEMSMSQDATCSGITNPGFGMNTFVLWHTINSWPRAVCQFPEWLRRDGSWRDVAGRWRMTVEERNEELAFHDLLHPDFLVPGEEASETRLRARCLEVQMDQPAAGMWTPGLRETHVLTFATNDSCVSGYRCIRMKQRENQVFEMRIGAPSDDTYLACQEAYFTGSETHVFFPHEQYTVVPCPLNGSYTYLHREGPCTGTLDIGCEYKNQMLLRPSCSPRTESAEILQCFRTWSEGTKQYVIAGRPSNAYNPVSCLVLEEKGNKQRMAEAMDCGPTGSFKIMDQAINYTFTSTRKQCELKDPATSYHPNLPPAEGGTGDSQAHLQNAGDGTSTSRPGGGKARPPHAPEKTPKDLTDGSTVHVINNSNARTCASLLVRVGAVLTLALHWR